MGHRRNDLNPNPNNPNHYFSVLNPRGQPRSQSSSAISDVPGYEAGVLDVFKMASLTWITSITTNVFALTSK